MRKALSIIIITFIIFILPVHAAESSPSANTQAKLKTLQDSIASKAAKLTAQVSKKLQNRAYVGYVATLSQNYLTLNTKTGTKSASVNQFTKYQGKNLSFKTISSGDYIAILGDIDENSVLTVSKVIQLAKPDLSERQIIWGTVIKKGQSQINLKSKDTNQLTLEVLPTTKYQIGKETASFNDVQINRNIIAIVLKTDLKYKIRFIYIPKSATPSAEQR